MSGVDPEQASTIDFARYRETKKDWPVQRGFGALVARIGQGAPVRLGTRVDRIRWSGEGVRVETSRGVLRARAVVVTVSTGVLESGGILFEPALPDWKREAIEGLPLGLLNKVLVRFDRDRFGVRPGRFVTYEPWAPETMGMVVMPFGMPLVVGHVGGRHADVLERSGAGAMKDFAFEVLRNVFGGAVLAGVQSVVTTSWRGDPLARGAYSAALPGCGHLRKVLARAVGRRLFFAGEACSPEHFSTVHGAYLTGLRAAEAVARAV